MDLNNIQSLLPDDDFVIIKRKNSIFIQFDHNIPSELKDKISSDDYEKLVKRYNKGFKMGSLSIILGLTIVLLPVAAYLFYKKIEILTLLWYKEQDDYRKDRASFQLLDASKKKATLVFKFQKQKV